MSDISGEIQDRVARAVVGKTPLCIRGGGSKSFYGNPCVGGALEMGGHSGVVDYEPTELVITVRGGTSLGMVEETLKQEGQMLAFEPPHYGAGATIGGTIACGLSGPRRPYAGAARDFMLGARIVNGEAKCMVFGGRVMKNVAGYDVSRLMVGAMGTLGVLLDVSLKVLPRPKLERTLVFSMHAPTAVKTMNEWAGKPIPVSATCHVGGELYVRLSGSERGVLSAVEKMPDGSQLEPTESEAFWDAVKEHTSDFFNRQGDLWRVSVPPTTSDLDIPGEWLLEWNGGLRWLTTVADAATIRDRVATAGGHATHFRGSDAADVFHPLTPGLDKLHRNLKHAFDPHGILNPGKMYTDI